MGQNGKDTSGNAFKYSLIPLFIGIVLIFFLYRACGNSTYEPQPKSSTSSLNEEKRTLEETAEVNVVWVKEENAA